MITYSEDPAGINLSRLRALVEARGGTVEVFRGRKLDGSPGVAQLNVSLPFDGDTPEARTAFNECVTQATGISDSNEAAAKVLRDRLSAKSVLDDPGPNGKLARAALIAFCDDNKIKDAKDKLKAGKNKDALDSIIAVVKAVIDSGDVD